MFGVVDLMLKNAVFDLLSFKIYCHTFFYRRGWTAAAKCYRCIKIFIDDSDFVSKIDKAFTFTYDDIKNTEVSFLFNYVKAKSVTLNL